MMIIFTYLMEFMGRVRFEGGFRSIMIIFTYLISGVHGLGWVVVKNIQGATNLVQAQIGPQSSGPRLAHLNNIKPEPKPS